MADACEVLVIGAGPAGLTAALYLGRYHRAVTVVHDGRSRARRIPLTHNAPGFPDGISGPELLARMEDQARLYGAEIRQGHVKALRRTEAGYAADLAEGGAIAARAVILATGVTLNEIDLPHDLHEQAIGWGALRYCPICDGYEATDREVGVLGGDEHGGREALFLRQFTAHVTLLSRTRCDLTDEQRQALDAAGVRVLDAAVTELDPSEDGFGLKVAGSDERLRFDVLYPALGAEPRSELAAGLGVALSPGGCIPTDGHQAVGAPGLYAAGDVVEALNQISVAVGHGAIAATKAHNDLREADGHVLRSAPAIRGRPTAAL